MASSQATPSPFGHLLRRFRRTANLTQEALAARAGISLRGVSDLERGINRAPRRETVQLLADALQLGPQDRTTFEAAARARVSPSVAIPTSLGQVASGVAAAASAGPPAFVGRQREMARITRHLCAAPGTASAPLLLVAGEPGIGKSRLLAEAARAAAAAGWQVLTGGCTRRSGQQPYAPLGDTLARSLVHLSLAEQRHALAGCAWLVRLLPELLETAVVPAPSWTLPPDQERRLMFAAVARCLANVVGPAGTLLLLDDLQWAGGDALDLLDSLVHTAAEASAPSGGTTGISGTTGPLGSLQLRIVGAYRSSEVDAHHPLGTLQADLARVGLAARCPLRPLPAAEARTLAAELVIASGAGEANEAERSALVEWLTRQAGGVPFYLVNYVQAAQASALETGSTGVDGVVPAAEAETSQTDGEAAGAVPWLVAETIRQRVAALPERAGELLSVAAVIGRVVPYALLASVAASVVKAPEADVLSAVDAACRAHLLEEWETRQAELASSGGRTQYQFAHDLIREVVLADLGAARRIRLHGAVAGALEQLPEAKRAHEGRAAELAHHFVHAEEPARALPYALAAGDQAEARYAHAEAERHYRTAVQLTRELGELAREAEALEKLGVVLRYLARYDEALGMLEAALHATTARGDIEGEGRVASQISWVHEERGTAAVGAAYLTPLVERLGAQGLSPAGMCRLSVALARLLNRAHFHRSSSVGEGSAAATQLRDLEAVAARAMELARALGDSALLVESTRYWGTARIEQGYTDDAAQAFAAVMPLADAPDVPVDLAFALIQMGSMFVYMGDLSQTKQCVERAVKLVERGGYPLTVAYVWVGRGELAYYAGDWAQARCDLEQALATMHGVKTSLSFVYAALYLGLLFVVTGQEAAAVPYLEEALALAERQHDLQGLRFAQGILAEQDVLGGRADGAREHLEPLLDQPGLQEFEVLFVLPQLAWACLESGVQAQDEALIRRADALSAESCVRARALQLRLFLVDALRVRAMVCIREEEWGDATQTLDEAIKLCRAMSYPYAEAKALYVYGQLHAARGEPEQARTQYVQARSICARLGEGLYRPHIERALADLTP
jgi:tetratricopeptide (TPR) repeat protein/transcriptional regulator with XRE-family HTH domain